MDTGAVGYFRSFPAFLDTAPCPVPSAKICNIREGGCNMRKILDVKIDETGKVTFYTEYHPLKGMNLYQRAFVSFMFEPDMVQVRKWMAAIRLLGIADLCASRNPELTMSMFERTADELAETIADFKRHLGGNLNFNPATV